jgi:hypothetical protein
MITFLIFYRVGKPPWTRDQPVASPLSVRKTTQIQNKRTQTSIPQVGLEHMIPVIVRAKTVYVLDRAATVLGTHLGTL